ncbi:MAG TPA: CBS domain-containing protein [Polyangiaceae bacterium]|nr:CBS domain-containing protein [Polyangiaceae bacterium]
MTLKFKDLEVSDLMTRNVVSVRASEPLSTAAKRLWDGDCGAIPVLEDEGERVVGMITDRDICMATWSRNRAPSAILTAEAMSQGLISCSPTDSIDAAEGTMRSGQVRRLPVLDSERRLVGILSITDIARVARERSATRPGFDVSPLQVIDTLNMITNNKLKTTAHGRVSES